MLSYDGCSQAFSHFLLILSILIYLNNKTQSATHNTLTHSFTRKEIATDPKRKCTRKFFSIFFWFNLKYFSR